MTEVEQATTDDPDTTDEETTTEDATPTDDTTQSDDTMPMDDATPADEATTPTEADEAVLAPAKVQRNYRPDRFGHVAVRVRSALVFWLSGAALGVLCYRTVIILMGT